MSYPTTPEFEKHSENLRAIKKSFLQIERLHKRAIREADDPATLALRIWHHVSVGIMAEALLRQIVSDPLGFNERERQSIWNQNSQEGRWLHAVDLAFYRHYGIQFHQELSISLTPAVQRRRATVQGLLNHELKNIITARNKNAHGQWVWHLKSRKENEFTADRPPAAPNYVQINASKRLILAIGRLVHILVISEPTFGRDFNEIEGEIDVFKRQLDGADYLQFESELRRTKRGR
ncbi:hypothetical protein [Rhodococcus sp. SGAir0479]|uniref:hypothetical protein n=1 Tax=Rhodococcus sp. SGAir0479 TaxID=2567884 RepID=UPI0010CD258F|nr:hypothetical protein [Rhodococcus sp. SGAir0479]QCQ90490.1 hypothetical protein E7742_04115 [Rhodococcus sp. SGAir0479]